MGIVLCISPVLSAASTGMCLGTSFSICLSVCPWSIRLSVHRKHFIHLTLYIYRLILCTYLYIYIRSSFPKMWQWKCQSCGVTQVQTLLGLVYVHKIVFIPFFMVHDMTKSKEFSFLSYIELSHVLICNIRTNSLISTLTQGPVWLNELGCWIT